MNKFAKLFAGMAVISLAASCSSDEPMGGNTDDQANAERYLAVNIMSTGTAGSRAWSDGSFEDGTKEENQVDNALFVFYDENAKMSQTPQLINLSMEAGSTRPQTSAISKAVVTIAGQKAPKWMLVVINPTQSIRTSINGLTLEESYDLIGAYGSNVAPFVMTNSSYYDNRIVKATDIANKSFNSREEAAREDNVVNVYVERVVAKVNVTKESFALDLENENAPNTITVDNADGTTSTITLVPDIRAVELANIATKSFLFKKISSITSWMNTWSGVNDIANKRSYWAITVDDSTEGYDNQSWKEIDESDDSWNKEEHNYYVHPNTATSHRTSVLVTAILRNQNNNEAVSLVKWGGNYYLKDNFKNQIALFLNNEGYGIVEEEVDNKATKHTTFDASNVDYINAQTHAALLDAEKIHAYQSIGCVNAGIKVGKDFKEDGTYTLVGTEELQNFFLREHHVFNLWEDGLAYYFKEIEHNPTYEPFKYGVIRNHIYNLNITSLSGLGVPVVNATETIIPENPDDKLFYVGAKVNILKWRNVPTQSVEF